MEEKKLPLFGVGPAYVISICAITIIAAICNNNDIIPKYAAFNSLIAACIGIATMILGVYLWINAVLASQLFIFIKEDKLVTGGIFGHVRNPIYSAFLFICIGILLIVNNIYLLLLPVGYWILLTILMMKTEEKWLKEKYKEEYVEYCKHVNRCFPKFKKYKKN